MEAVSLSEYASPARRILTAAAHARAAKLRLQEPALPPRRNADLQFVHLAGGADARFISFPRIRSLAF
jgi:hypothetical protein